MVLFFQLAELKQHQYQHTLGSNGSPPNPSLLQWRSHTSASVGTCKHVWCISLMKRESNIWRQSWNGKQSPHTTLWTPNTCTGSSSTPHWCYLQGEPTSPAWRACSPSSITVLLCHTPHHGILQVIYGGGSGSSPMLTYHIPSGNPVSPLNMAPTPKPAPDSES